MYAIKNYAQNGFLCAKAISTAILLTLAHIFNNCKSINSANVGSSFHNLPSDILFSFPDIINPVFMF